jgi:hypothetical protein
MKKEKLNELSEQIKNNPVIFLNYLKANYPLFHNSNFFFRDLQYGIKKYLEIKEIEITYPEAEELAKHLSHYFEGEGIFVKVSDSTWKINFPEFVTQIPGDPL